MKVKRNFLEELNESLQDDSLFKRATRSFGYKNLLAAKTALEEGSDKWHLLTKEGVKSFESTLEGVTAFMETVRPLFADVKKEQYVLYVDKLLSIVENSMTLIAMAKDNDTQLIKSANEIVDEAMKALSYCSFMGGGKFACLAAKYSEAEDVLRKV